MNYFIISAISQIVILIIIISYSAFISFLEKEQRAMWILIFSDVMLVIALTLLCYCAGWIVSIMSVVINIVFVVGILVLLIPLRKSTKKGREIPLPGYDERDTIFSRQLLEPGTDKYNEYYSRHSEYEDVDAQNRSRPGLLSEESVKFNPSTFYLADASFFTVEALKKVVDGAVAVKRKDIDSEQLTTFIKTLAKRYGAADSGVTLLKDYHKYSVIGRGAEYGKEVELKHKYAFAFIVEMDKDLIDCAPNGPVVTETSRVYLDSGVIAVQIAEFIRKLGYSARAHIDGNYRVICPLVARDAGLGEIGRMGLLMTHKHGPRVRIAVVTTDIELVEDNRPEDNSIRDFCAICKKCSENCPTKAISFDVEKNINGVMKWQVDHSSCFSFWTINGTDCARCISVCPYSHPNNLLHNFVRWGIRNNYLFMKLALKLDDLMYGRKPKIKPEPDWLHFDSAQ